MFERFTERARQVVVLAQEEARGLRHNYIGSEHLLLGILREGEGVGARVLASFDVTADGIRERLVEVVSQGEEAVSGQIPFTPRAKRVCEMSLREALSLGHNYIGTEHILLGLARDGEGLGMRFLQAVDVDERRIRDAVIEVLSGPRVEARRNEQVEGVLTWLEGRRVELESEMGESGFWEDDERAARVSREHARIIRALGNAA